MRLIEVNLRRLRVVGFFWTADIICQSQRHRTQSSWFSFRGKDVCVGGWQGRGEGAAALCQGRHSTARGVEVERRQQTNWQKLNPLRQYLVNVSHILCRTGATWQPNDNDVSLTCTSDVGVGWEAPVGSIVDGSQLYSTRFQPLPMLKNRFPLFRFPSHLSGKSLPDGWDHQHHQRRYPSANAANY